MLQHGCAFATLIALISVKVMSFDYAYPILAVGYSVLGPKPPHIARPSRVARTNRQIIRDSLILAPSMSGIMIILFSCCLSHHESTAASPAKTKPSLGVGVRALPLPPTPYNLTTSLDQGSRGNYGTVMKSFGVPYSSPQPALSSVAIVERDSSPESSSSPSSPSSPLDPHFPQSFGKLLGEIDDLL